MLTRTQTLAALMFAVGCSGPPKPGEPLTRTVYLPSQPYLCIPKRDPAPEPKPPDCALTRPPTCTDDQYDEYTAQRLDHGDELAKWIRDALILCGRKVTP